MVNTAWRHQTHRRAMIVFGQLQAALAAAPSREEADAFLTSADNPYLSLLDELYGEDYQLGRLLDTSDLVVHAEGPSVTDALPALRATAWLCEVSNKQLRRLLCALMDLSSEHTCRQIGRAIDLRMTGLAPGSLYAGFHLAHNPGGLLEGAEDAAYQEAKSALQGLSQVPSFVGADALLPGLSEAMPDPALRDASLVTAYHLSPTGKLGVHTLSLSVPGEQPGALGQRERVVLRDALRHPDTKATHSGRFVGEVRSMDMDKTRFHLRHVTTIGTLRCALPELSAQEAKELIGETVAVSGRYAVDQAGRPRLLLVDSLSAIEVLQRPEQQAIAV